MITLIKSILKNHFVIFAIIIESLVALVMSGMPLFNVLDYESSITLAFIHSIVVLLISVNFTRKNTGFFKAKYLLLTTNFILFLPFIILFVSSIVHHQCALHNGFLFFFFYPILSGFVSILLGFSIVNLVKNKFSYVIAFFLPLFSLLITLLKFYFEPPIFAYDPFFGYFSGAFYDRAVFIKPAFLFARSYHLFLAIFIASSVLYLKKINRSKSIVLFSIISGLSTILLLALPQTGFSQTSSTIRRSLGKTLYTKHFSIFYSKKIPLNQVRILSAEAEFYYYELTSFFHSHPKSEIKIYLFANTSEKRNLFGAREVEVAKPWLNSVFITNEDFPHSSLKHELAHVFGGAFGDRFFKISFSKYSFLGINIPIPNPGFIEGLAVAASFRTNNTNYDELAAIMFKLKKNVPLKYVFSPMFYSYSSRIAYIESGSFMRFIYRKYGFKTFKEIFKEGGMFEKHTSRTLLQLENEYLNYLKTIRINPELENYAKRIFSVKPLHKRRCLHETAREEWLAYEYYKQKNYVKASYHIKKAISYDPNNINLYFKYMNIVEDTKDFRTVSQIADKIIDLSEGKFEDYEAKAYLVKAKIAWLNNNIKKAKLFLAKVDKNSLSSNIKRSIILFSLIFKSKSKVQSKLKKLFGAKMNTKKAVKYMLGIENFKLSSYLAGSMALNAKMFKIAKNIYSKINPKDLHEKFVCEFYRRYLKVSLLLKDFDLTYALQKKLRKKCPYSIEFAEFYKKIADFWQKHQSLLTWSVKN